jgi:tetratricopeptide (TPR) repeat protein
MNDKLGTANTLNNLGYLNNFQGNYAESGSWYKQALKIYREIGEKHDIAATLVNLGNLPLLSEADFAAAEAALEEALTIFGETGDRLGIGFVHATLGNLALFRCNYEEARSHDTKALETLREIGNRRGVALQLNNLGEIAYYMKDFALALEYNKESVIMHREIGNKYGIAEALNNLVFISLECNDCEESWEKLEEALTIRKDIQDKEGIIHSLSAGTELNIKSGNLVKAAKLAGAADAMRETIGSPLMPYQMERYNETISLLKNKLGEEAFIKVWEEGKSMTMEEAVELALEK